MIQSPTRKSAAFDTIRSGIRILANQRGFRVGFPTGMLSPAAAGMQAGLAALRAGLSAAAGALPPAEFRAALGYGDYDDAAKPFIVPG